LDRRDLSDVSGWPLREVAVLDLYLICGEDGIVVRPVTVRTHEGRLDAAHNLISCGIDCLAVCGGDGSLTGADMLRKEWPSLVEELLNGSRITEDQAETYKYLNIVGLVGSIE
jgi:6-phosphofructokinase 1